MATITNANVQQSTREVRAWVADFTNDLPSGGTITAGTAFHTPPSGAATIPTVDFTATTVTAFVGPLTVTGQHYVDIQATYSDSQKAEVRIAFTVNYPTDTARVGMSALVATLRGMTNAGVNDYTVADVPYWSDKHLQDALDRYVTPIRDANLTANPITGTGGTVEWYDYQSNARFFETTTGGTARFVVRDSTGSIQGTAAWSADYENGRITFAANTKGTAYYVTGYSYDVYAAAADIWYQKAAHASEMVDVSIDKHNIKRSHLANMAYQMAQRYDLMSGGMSRVTEVVRGDMR